MLTLKIKCTSQIPFKRTLALKQAKQHKAKQKRKQHNNLLITQGQLIYALPNINRNIILFTLIKPKLVHA